MNTLWQDLRYALRTLMKKPGFTAVAVLTLALGIGANTAVFSVVNTVLLRPFPYPNAERLIYVWRAESSEPGREFPISAPNFEDLRNRNQSFEAYFAFSNASVTLTGDSRPEALSGVRASADFWRVVGVSPALGRAFTAEEDAVGKNHVALISDELWKRRFGGDQQAIGQSIQLNGEPHTIIGVMEPGFNFPRADVEIWMPLGIDMVKQPRGQHFLSTIGRLKPGITIEQARADLQKIAGQLREEFPDFGQNYSFNPEPLREHVFGDLQRPLMILLGAVALVLLIACVNVANLLLSRATARWKEMALRTALGASRWSLIRLLLIESVLLAMIGGAGGLLLAWWGVDLLTKINPAALPSRENVAIDAVVLAFTFLVSLAAGVVFGLVPAWQTTKMELNQALRESSRTATGAGGLKLVRSGLVVTEVALSLVLLVGAGLLLQSLWKLLEVNPGFQPEQVVTGNISLPPAKYGEEWRQVEFFRRTLEQVRALPDVQSAGFATSLPFSNSRGHSTFRIDDRPTAANDSRPSADRHQVAPGYFGAMGIPLVAGRDFTDLDDTKHPGVVIINETTAKLYWPDENPIGKRLTIGMDQEVKLYGKPVSREIIGVIGNVKHAELKADFQPEMYIPAYQLPPSGMTLIVRGQAPTNRLIAAMRQAVETVDPEQPIRGTQLLETAIARSVAPQRFVATLLFLFAGLALLLAVVGIYGVMSYTVTQRTPEIGIRMALGAQKGDVFKLIVGQGLTLALTGVVVGVGAAFALTRLMSSLLFGISATDPLTFATVSLILTGVALVACLVPARRAARTDPMVALRYE